MKAKYAIVYGNRRFNACKKLGWKTIPALLDGELVQAKISEVYTRQNIRSEVNDSELAELMQSIKQNGVLQPIKIKPSSNPDDESFVLENITENLQRKDITPIELGKTVKELKEVHGLTLGEISVRLGVEESKLKGSLRLFNDCPEQYKDSIGFNAKFSKSKPINYTIGLKVLNTQFLSAKKKENLLEYCQKKSPTMIEFNKILSLTERGGLSVKDAVRKAGQISTVNVNILFDKKVLEHNMKRGGYKVRQHFFRDILSGVVPPPKNLVFK